MSEFEQLKRRIDNSGPDGVKTSDIIDDYDPIGERMMEKLVESGEYSRQRTPVCSGWVIIRKEYWRDYR